MYSRNAVVGLILGCVASASAVAEVITHYEAVQIALQRNPEVIGARKAWEAARARSIQAGAWASPELELEYEGLPAPARLGGYEERSLGVTQQIEWPIKWLRRRRAARLAANGVRLRVYETALLEVATRVKIACDRVLLEQSRLGYAEANAELARDFLEKARLRREAGDVPQLDVLRAEVESGRADSRLTEARNDLAMARAELNTLLARDIGTPLEAADPGRSGDQPSTPALEQLRELALARRLDLQGAARLLASSRSEAGAARAAFVPDLSLGVFRQTIRRSAGTESYWRVGVAMELPVWGAARERGALAEANAVSEQSAAETDRLRSHILLEVESAFLETQAAATRVQLFGDRIVREAERSLEVADSGYREGKTTYLELLDAQRTLMEIREEDAVARFDQRAAQAELERAVGGELMQRSDRQEEGRR